MDCAPPSCPSQCLRLLQIVSAVIPQSALLEYMCGQNNSLNDRETAQSDYVHVMAVQNSDYCSMEQGGDQNSRWWPPLGLWRPTLTSFTSLMHLLESKLLRFTYHYQCRDAATCMEYKLSPSLERRLGVLHNCTVCYQRGLLDLFVSISFLPSPLSVINFYQGVFCYGTGYQPVLFCASASAVNEMNYCTFNSSN